MTATIEARIAEVLAGHALRGVTESRTQDTCTFRCDCGHEGDEKTPLPWPSPAHAAHQAAMLAPMIRAALEVER